MSDMRSSIVISNAEISDTLCSYGSFVLKKLEINIVRLATDCRSPAPSTQKRLHSLGGNSRRLANTKKDKPDIRRRLEQINSDPQVQKHYGQIITEEEMDAFVEIADRSAAGSNYQGEYWIPLQWCTRLLAKSREAELIMAQNRQYTMMVKMLNDFRGNLGTLTIYNDVNIPLVYTQVLVIAVYAFFLAEVFSSQQLTPDADPRKKNMTTSFPEFLQQGAGQEQFDHYFPIFSVFKFIFFMGWFKTAICLMNPFGDDVNSIPTNEILDYNLMVGQKSGGAEDFLYPPYLHDDADAGTQLNDMFSRLVVKKMDKEIRDLENDGEDAEECDPEDKMLPKAAPV